MAPAKPAILILHGSWHQPSHFGKLIPLLHAQGYEALCPLQPSFNAQPATTTLQDDASSIKRVLSRLVDEDGKDVILLMHSYGGMVGTEVVSSELSARSRSEQGLRGGVVKLLYMCAFLLHKGESLLTPFGGKIPPFLDVEADGSLTMQDPQQRFYNDLEPAEQKHWASLLKPIPLATQNTALTNEAFRYVSASYLFCDDDQALPLFKQEELVRNAGVDIQTEHCGAGHSPFLSMPEKVVEVVERLGW